MPIKKSMNFNSESWANQAPHVENITELQERKKTDKKISFAARIPESLYNELKKYLETYADEKESINDIMILGARAELETRLKKHNAIIAAETRREELIETIEKSVKELKTLY